MLKEQKIIKNRIIIKNNKVVRDIGKNNRIIKNFNW